LKITKATADFVKVKLIGPFGFKGKYVDHLWLPEITLYSGDCMGKGYAVQSVLWSDSKIFEQNTSAGGNTIMFAMTNYALKLIEGEDFASPEEMTGFLLPKVLEYGKTVSQNPDMRSTFALNALVGVDYAAWALFANLNGFKKFDDIIPDYAKSALSGRASALSRIPLVTYGLGDEQINDLIFKEKDYFLKIKIGNDPDGDKSQKKMVEWDKKRLEQIHNIAKQIDNPNTTTGFIPYYLDANGRYETKGALLDFLEHADKIGALERIIFIEEPFDEKNEIDVKDIPVRIAGDESAHTLEDAKNLIDRGYGAIALKPIAKTQSVSFQIAAYAKKVGVPVFCADLTVPPNMLEWNKQFASRLDLLPTMKIGVIESNGHQNYPDWDKWVKELPKEEKDSRTVTDGKFILSDSFYNTPFSMF